MSTAVMTQRLSVFGEQTGPFTGIDASCQLDIWEDGTGKLLIRLMKDDKAFATKTFRDCETQHSDSERWLNDEVKYPNPFAGILLNRARE